MENSRNMSESLGLVFKSLLVYYNRPTPYLVLSGFDYRESWHYINFMLDKNSGDNFLFYPVTRGICSTLSYYFEAKIFSFLDEKEFFEFAQTHPRTRQELRRRGIQDFLRVSNFRT